jgi:type II secretory pathway pseudopilin PulG
MTRHCADFKAFTLVELLVAMAVGILLLLVTISIVGQSSQVTRQTTAGLLATSAAASAVDLIATDLESLASSSPGTILEMVPLTSINSFGEYGELFFLAIPGSDNAAEADRGQVRAVAYRIVDQDPIRAGGTNPTPGLYRTIIDTESTFTTFLGIEDLAQAFAAVPPSLDDFLVGDVASLEVRVFTANGTNAENQAGGFTRSIRLTRESAHLAGTQVTGEPWAWIEVRVSVLENRDDILNRLRRGGQSDAERRQLLEAQTQRLTRRIPLQHTF